MAPHPKPGSTRHGAPVPAPGPGTAGRHGGDALADECAALETEVEELKVKYEMYFLGVERGEPNKWRDDLKKKVNRLKEQFTRNTGLRFRIQSLHARFISYERLWLRNAREKEEGTYRRDLFKARLRRESSEKGKGGKGKREAAGMAEAEDVDLSDFGYELALTPAPMPVPVTKAAAPPAAPPTVAPAAARAAPRPAAPEPPRPAAPPPPKASPATGLREAQVKAIYDAYVEAKRRCNEDVSRITPDAIARTIARQTPEIMKQHNAREVEFKVVIKDGRAILKAVPKV